VSQAKRYDNYINGEWVAGADYRTNINPSELSDAIGDYAKADLPRSTPPSMPPAPRSGVVHLRHSGASRRPG
jgi:hypothetical protein